MWRLPAFGYGAERTIHCTLDIDISVLYCFLAHELAALDNGINKPSNRHFSGHARAPGQVSMENLYARCHRKLE